MASDVAIGGFLFESEGIASFVRVFVVAFVELVSDWNIRKRMADRACGPAPVTSRGLGEESGIFVSGGCRFFMNPVPWGSMVRGLREDEDEVLYDSKRIS